MYQIGEHIMYKNIGICVVEEIGKPGFSADKEKEYYTLRPLDATGNARIYVPVDSDIFMRNIITKKEACIYLKELESMEAAPFYISKPAQLKAHYDGLMARHDIAGHLKLFKELYQKEKKTKEHGKKFGEMESNYKKQVEHLLVDEFSYALNETPELSKERLYRAMA